MICLDCRILELGTDSITHLFHWRRQTSFLIVKYIHWTKPCSVFVHTNKTIWKPTKIHWLSRTRCWSLLSAPFSWWIQLDNQGNWFESFWASRNYEGTLSDFGRSRSSDSCYSCRKLYAKCFASSNCWGCWGSEGYYSTYPRYSWRTYH